MSRIITRIQSDDFLFVENSQALVQLSQSVEYGHKRSLKLMFWRETRCIKKEFNTLHFIMSMSYL